jgi:hypothetical protein
MSVSISGEGSVTGIDQGLNVVGVVTASQVNVGSAVTIHTGGFQVGFTSIHSTGTIVAAGSTSAPSMAPTGDSNTGIFFPSADTIAFAEGGVEALRIDSSSNIGIRTVAPLSPLHINGNAQPTVVIGQRFSSAHSNSVGAAKSVFVYIDREPESTIWSDASNRDTFFSNSLYVRTPVKDGVNNPAIVIAENGGQASGKNSLVFWNDDLNNTSGYIKSRIYTEVGGSYNSTAFYIDVADSNKAIQNRLKIDVAGRVSKPYQPHIFGSVTNTSTATNSLANSMNVVSSTELTFSNSRITVPVAGLYLITFCTLSAQDSSRKDANIIINGTSYVNMLSEDTTTGYHYRGGSLTVKLSANDYIQFFNQSWYNNTSTSFDAWRTASVTFLG